MPITTNEVSQYRFENAGNLGLDSIGTNNLTNNNGVTQAVGQVGKAGSFASASVQSLSIASNASLQLGGANWEITCWVYPVTLTTSRTILGKWDGVAQELLLYWEASNSQFTVAMRESFGNTLIFWGDGITTTTLNTWYFLDIYMDRAANAGAGGLSIALNNGAAVTTAGLGPVNNTRPFSIGTQSDGTSSPWNGRIDEVNIWTRLLTPTERTAKFNETSTLRRRAAGYYF